MESNKKYNNYDEKLIYAIEREEENNKKIYREMALQNNNSFQYKWRLRLDVNEKRFLDYYGFNQETESIYAKYNNKERDIIRYCTSDRSISFTKGFYGQVLHFIIDGYVRFENIDGEEIPRKNEFLYTTNKGEIYEKPIVDTITPNLINNYKIINVEDGRVIFEGPIKNEIAHKWKEKRNIKVELM